MNRQDSEKSLKKQPGEFPVSLEGLRYDEGWNLNDPNFLTWFPFL
ncbi:MAG: hypothetical protein ACHQUC_08500 [Chlamydiales bacterium]